ncbi:unnamed protein product [Sympodiomycopsis kandeliae]
MASIDSTQSTFIVMVPSMKRLNQNRRSHHHQQQQHAKSTTSHQSDPLLSPPRPDVDMGRRPPLVPREMNLPPASSSPVKNAPPPTSVPVVSSDSVLPGEPLSSSSSAAVVMDPFGIEQFLPALTQPVSPRSGGGGGGGGGGGRNRRKAPPSYNQHNHGISSDTNTNANANGPATHEGTPQTPRGSRRSRGHRRTSSPQKNDLADVEINYDAKKHVQAFFKAFGDTFEPRMKNVVDASMTRQGVALRGTIARHEEEVRDLVRKHDDRMSEVIARHKDDMASALLRAEGHMEEHLSAQTFEAAMTQYEKDMQDYIRKRATGRMLFWAAFFGIIVITAVFNLDLLHGHLGGILGFSISAGYMYLSYRKAVPIPPRRPCPYPSIQGPWVPLQDEGGFRREPQRPWYMNLRKYVPWNREPAAYGLFD